MTALIKYRVDSYDSRNKLTILEQNFTNTTTLLDQVRVCSNNEIAQQLYLDNMGTVFDGSCQAEQKAGATAQEIQMQN